MSPNVFIHIPAHYVWNQFHFYEQLLGRYERIVDHLAVQNLAYGARLLGGVPGHFILNISIFVNNFIIKPL